MNFSKTLGVLSASILLVACGSSEDPQAFGEDLFDKLKQGQSEAIIELTANEDDYYWMVSEKSKEGEASKKPSPAEVSQHVAKQKRKVKKAIDEIIAYGKMNGGWDNATLAKVEFDELGDDFSQDITLHIEIDEKQYRILFDDVASTDRGHVLADDPRWLGLSYDPQFDKLIGEKLGIKPNKVFVSCETPQYVATLDILLRGKSNNSEVTQFLNSGKCSANKSSSAVTVTSEELGEYTYSSQKNYFNKKAEFPFEEIKISFEIDGQSKSGWTYVRWLADQAN